MLETVFGVLMLNIAFAIALSFGIGILGLLYFKHYCIHFQERYYKVRIFAYIFLFTFTITTLTWLSIMGWSVYLAIEVLL